MEIPKEHCRVYQDVRKYSLNAWALELADALQWAVAQAMSFEDLFLNIKRPDGTIIDWLAEADKELMRKEQPK